MIIITGIKYPKKSIKISQDLEMLASANYLLRLPTSIMQAYIHDQSIDKKDRELIQYHFGVIDSRFRLLKGSMRSGLKDFYVALELIKINLDNEINRLAPEL